MMIHKITPIVDNNQSLKHLNTLSVINKWIDSQIGIKIQTDGRTNKVKYRVASPLTTKNNLQCTVSLTEP